MSDKSREKSGIALVIGSGSVKCAAAVGLWKVLEREGIILDRVVGCSGGSIYAAGIALGYEIGIVEEMTLSFWTSDLMAGYTSNLKATMTGDIRFNEKSGLVDPGPAYERLETAFGERTFADTKIPLQIVATDMSDGEKVILTGGKILDAVRASISIPIVFPPVELDGKLLTDGAVSDPLPVDVAIKEGASIILAMGFELPTRKRLRSFNAVQSHLSAIYMNNILKSTYAFYNLAHHAEIIPMIPDFEGNISNFDTQHLPHIIQKGEDAMEEMLPYVKRLLGS